MYKTTYNPHKIYILGMIRNTIPGDITKELCLPLYAILSSIGNPIIDYFSLDVEGSEIGILQTIPWDKVHIKVHLFYIKVVKESTVAQ